MTFLCTVCHDPLPYPPVETQALLRLAHHTATTCPADLALAASAHRQALREEKVQQRRLLHAMADQAVATDTRKIVPQRQHKPGRIPEEQLWAQITAWMATAGRPPRFGDFAGTANDLPTRTQIKNLYGTFAHLYEVGAQRGVWPATYQEEATRTGPALTTDAEFWEGIQTWRARHGGKIPHTIDFVSSSGLPSAPSLFRRFGSITGFRQAGLDLGHWTIEELRHWLPSHRSPGMAAEETRRPPKHCHACNAPITRHLYPNGRAESEGNWQARKHCSRSCYAQSQRNWAGPDLETF